MKNVALTLCLALLIAPCVHAQDKKKTSSTPAKVEVREITDRRGTGHFSSMDLALQLPAVLNADVAAYRVLLSSAKDDTGLDLINKDRPEQEFTGNRGNFMPGQKDTSPLNARVTLKNPARPATRIKELSGEIELYMPAKDSSSVAIIPKFLSQSGKALSHKALKANGVEVTLISKSQLEAEKKRLGEKKRKDAIAEGMEGEGLEYVVSSFLEYFLKPDEGDVVVRIKDPNKRIHEFEYVKAGGESQTASSRDDNDSGMTVLSAWGDKPAADTSLRIMLKPPKSMARHSFKVTDVPLP